MSGKLILVALAFLDERRGAAHLRGICAAKRAPLASRFYR